MEDRFFLDLEGQEIQAEDIHGMSDNAGLADDRTLAELCRFVPFDGASAFKAVMPFSVMGPSGGPIESGQGLVVPSGSSDAKVRINPCRTFVGSRTDIATSPKSAWNDIRSAINLGSATLYKEQSIAATAANHRVDLLYARVDVDIDGPTVTRYVKDAAGAVSAQTVAVLKRTTVTLGVVAGVEGASPARPALPADGGGAYYIPLAYIFLSHPFTVATAITKTMIQEVAPPAPIASSSGGVSLLVPTGLWKVGGAMDANQDFSPGTRPEIYLPPCMGGGHRLVVPFNVTAFPASTVTVLDESIDWRKRVFEWRCKVTASGNFAWVGGGADLVPSVSNDTDANIGVTRTFGMGQSFFDDATALTAVAGGLVANIAPANLSAMAASSSVVIFARASDGKLCLWRNATSPAVRGFFFIDASGPYGNA